MTVLTPLPIDPLLPEIVAQLRERGALVLVAAPGAGKTTRVPPALLEAGVVEGKLLMLQPRRVAARAAARRIADERGWRLGAEVGYQVRFERVVSDETRLSVVTEGILTRALQRDPLLDGVGCVVLDEFHLRSIHADLCLALLREVREARPELRVVVMSATLQAQPVAAFLGGCPVIESEGRTFPIEIEQLSPAQLDGAATPSNRSRAARPATALDANLSARTARLVRRALADNPEGHVLVFLPGAGEIRRAAAAIGAVEGVDVLPLSGSLSGEAQDRALAPAPRGRRKVVLATNVAETSLTIEGVRVVIDSGLVKVPRHDARLGLDRLELARVSADSATQRAGRAGRTAPGRVYRMWSEARNAQLAPRTPPEIQRVDLAPTVLELRAWGADPRTFGWFEAPDQAALARARALLAQLGALQADDEAAITDLGRAMLSLPVHPRLARLLVGGVRVGQTRSAAGIAALLGERDIVRRDGAPVATRESSESDVLDRLDQLERLERRRGAIEQTIDAAAARTAARARDQLLRLVGGARPNEARDDSALRRLLLEAYPDRVCLRREGDADVIAPAETLRALMVGGRGVRLDKRSAVRGARCFVAIDVTDAKPAAARAARDDGSEHEALVRVASAVETSWLETRWHEVLELDERSGRVRAYSERRYLDLALERRDATPDSDAAATLLAQAARARGVAESVDLGRSEIAARVGSLRQWMPELSLPQPLELIDAALEELAKGCTSLEALRDVELDSFLLAQLDHRQRAALEREAPATLEVPSGSRRRLQYQPGAPPLLAVRIQEMFGAQSTPRVASGRVAVLLHLLAPNQRPAQVTQDLASFWQNGYPEVRKELRRRYPKHAWPEDPRTAKAERRPQRKRKR